MTAGNAKTYGGFFAAYSICLCLLLYSLFALFAFSGCTDPPNPVGSKIPFAGDYSSFQIDTLYATALPSFHDIVNTNGSDRIMLGKYQTYESWICLKFYLWPDTLIGATITRATLEMKASYHFGTDTNAALPFSIYRATADWRGNTFSFDSLQQRPGDYYDGTPIGTQTLTGFSDTDWVDIDIPDTALVRTWFTTNNDTLHLNDGLILRPTTNMNIIKGFGSLANATDTLRPRLIVSFKDANGDTGTYVSTTGFSRFVSTVPTASFPGNGQRIYVQNGISYLGFMSFENPPVSSVPSLFKATLEVTLDSASSIFNSYTDESLFVHSIGTNDSTDGLALSLSQTPVSLNGQRVYRTNVIGFIKLWLALRSTRRIALSGVDENRALDLFTFYGSDPSVVKSLRPRIIILYGLNN